ncbi:MAG TPA: hypothetical protein VIL11_04025 [Limnochordales bacterium]
MESAASVRSLSGAGEPASAGPHWRHPAMRRAAPAAALLVVVAAGAFAWRLVSGGRAAGADQGALQAAASAPAPLQAYEASVLVMAPSPATLAGIAGSREFQGAVSQLASATLGPDRFYRVSARPVPGAPVLVVTAQASLPEQASRLAHAAAELLIQRARTAGRQAESERARVLLGTCSPPTAVSGR